MERIPGVELRNRWLDIRGGEQVNPLFDGLFDIEASFGRCHFSQIGSLYFKEDVSKELQNRPLFMRNQTPPNLLEASNKYRIGPLADRQWWRGERTRMNIDRGPCKISRSIMIRSIDMIIQGPIPSHFSKPLCSANSHSSNQLKCFPHISAALVQQRRVRAW
jgi:hypothetical protein